MFRFAGPVAAGLRTAAAAAPRTASSYGRVAARRARMPWAAAAASRNWTAQMRTMATVVDAEFKNVEDVEPHAAGDSETMPFQAETRQLLDIVANSLYTDRHVFIRELISNASDALEKVRHLQATGNNVEWADGPLEIRIDLDEAAKTFTITDTGVGLSKDEMTAHLGTIAHSGSKAFLSEMASKGQAGDLDSNLIGQFGVGFYSAFMVSDSVDVFSKSCNPDEEGSVWKSAGDGTYTVGHASGVRRGTRVTVHLKDDCKEFSTAETVEEIVKTHSYFVPFPIYLNGKQVNTVKALWSMQPHEVDEEEYNAFYKHVSKAYDEPLYKLHFNFDAPVDLKALFYVGQMSREKFGTGVLPSGVSLYSHRVLIQPESTIMPQWLRFVTGVVDSEDIPLNISREGMQDSALMQRIRTVLVRRFLRFLDSESKKDPEKYAKFFKEFGMHIKEGICMDIQFQPECAKLLRFESSALAPGELTSLDEYVGRMEPSQQSIYYLAAPSRSLADNSPYMEAFRGVKGKTDTEVLYLYHNPVDDFVMSNLGKYNNRQLVTAEAGSVDVNKDGSSSKAVDDDELKSEDGDDSSAQRPLSSVEVTELGNWLMEKALPGKLASVNATNRLRSSPAVVTDHESAAMRRMLRLVSQTNPTGEGQMEEAELPKQKLEINPSHPVIIGLASASRRNTPLAITIAEQIFDNALTAAGLIEDPRAMLPRLNKLLEILTTQATMTASSVESDSDYDSDSD